MFLEQYNSLMSRMLNQWHALTKLRAEIEGREERVCWRCKRFGHLAYNYRNKKVKKKRKLIPQNKFKVIASRVMQYGVREEVKVKRQKTIEEVRCFRCWSIRHLKWEYPNIKVEKKRRREEKAVYVTRPQKVQQQERLVCPTQKKVQEYCKKQNAPPKDILLLERGQITKKMVAMYMNYGGYKGKEVQTCKNQGQGFLLKKQSRNMQCDLCQEVQNWRKGEAKRGKITRVECVKYRKRDAIMQKVLEQERKGILCPEYRIERKRE